MKQWTEIFQLFELSHIVYCILSNIIYLSEDTQTDHSSVCRGRGNQFISMKELLQRQRGCGFGLDPSTEIKES